jgi:aryl-alcohol dehydrogenase-like predicted oxidoreductase
MQELNRAGRARSIGVSNFHPDRVMDLVVHKEIVPAVDRVVAGAGSCEGSDGRDAWFQRRREPR